MFAPLLEALLTDERVTVYGPRDLDGGRRRSPSTSPVTRRPRWRGAGRRQIAVWDGNYYALEAMSSFGVEGAVRAGIAVYVSPDDVDRLIDAVQRALIAHRAGRARPR